MNKVSLLPLTIFISFLFSLNAQNDQTFWQVGIGYNFVDDSGFRMNDYFNFKEVWHAVPYPSRVSVGYYMENGLGLEVIGSYNEYDAGKIVDGDVLPEDLIYRAVDLKVSYDLNKLVGQTGWFDPYLMIGAGYTSVGDIGRATFNGGGGFNIWLSGAIGFNLNSMGKIPISNSLATSHLQHSLGLVFKLGADLFGGQGRNCYF